MLIDGKKGAKFFKEQEKSFVQERNIIFKYR